MAVKGVLEGMREHPGGWLLVLIVGTALAMTAAGEGWVVSLVLLALILSVPLSRAADAAKERLGLPRALTLTVLPVGMVLVVLASLALGGLQIGRSIAERVERDRLIARRRALAVNAQRKTPVPVGTVTSPVLAETAPSLTSAPALPEEAPPQRLADSITAILYRDWMRSIIDRQTLSDGIDQALKTGTAFIGKLLSQLLTGLSGFVTGLGVLLVSTLIAVRPGEYYRVFMGLFPPEMRRRLAPVAREVGHRLSRWAVARVMSASALALMTAVGLYLCGVKFAFGLGLITGLTSFIPIIGTIIGGVVAFLTVLVTQQGSWVGVLVVFVLANAIETYVLLPLLLRQAANIPPALTIGSLLVMGTVGGLPGMLIASPLVLVITTVGEMSSGADEPPAERAGGREG